MNASASRPSSHKRSFTVGSVCSGIEAASVAWVPLGFSFAWFSETARFPAMVLEARHASVPNLGDMGKLPKLIDERKIEAPDIICGGTPCQAFSLAGKKEGLADSRGNLTLRFVDIVDSAEDFIFWPVEKASCPKMFCLTNFLLKKFTNRSRLFNLRRLDTNSRCSGNIPIASIRPMERSGMAMQPQTTALFSLSKTVACGDSLHWNASD